MSTINETEKQSVKDEAKRLIDMLPDAATWDDVMYEFYVRQKVEAAFEQMEAGDIVSHEEVERSLGL